MSDNHPQDTSKPGAAWGGSLSRPVEPHAVVEDSGDTDESPNAGAAGEASDSSRTTELSGSSESSTSEPAESPESSENHDNGEHLGVGRPYNARQPSLQAQPWRQAGRPMPPSNSGGNSNGPAPWQQRPDAPPTSSASWPDDTSLSSPMARRRTGAAPLGEQPDDSPGVTAAFAEAAGTQRGPAGPNRPVAVPNGPAQNSPGQNNPAQNNPAQIVRPQGGPAQVDPVQNGPVQGDPAPTGRTETPSDPAPRAPQAARTPSGQGSSGQPSTGQPSSGQPSGAASRSPQPRQNPSAQMFRNAAGQQPPPRMGPPPSADDDPISEEVRRATPRYGFKGLLYKATRINLGPSKRDLDELEIRERLNRQTRRTRGYCGYIGIASEKGGVGKTTLASLLAAEIAEGRRESVGIADLNPDLGTLPDRFGVRPHYSIRDLLAHVDEIPWRYHVHDFMEKVPEMNVRVLAASTDRKIRHQLSVADVELLAELFAPFFSFAIFDNGTHITHEAMLGTLRTAHGMVLVTDNTRDGANLARKTLQFLNDNRYQEMRRRVILAVVAKETASPIKVRAIEKAFRDHVRDLVIVPYDPALDGGGKIPFRDPNAVNKLLRKETRGAVRRLAAMVMDDLVS